jgi:hypothetical protein
VLKKKNIEPFAVWNLEFGVYVGSFLLFLASLVWIGLSALSWSRWLYALSQAVVWLLVWYGALPLALNGLLFLVSVCLPVIEIGRTKHPAGKTD